jgi:transcriptional regulator with XRE-family HTH domain
MEDPMEPDVQSLLLRFARLLHNWGQVEMAAAGGVDPSSLLRYEKGKPPARKVLDRLLEGARLPGPFAEACLVPAFRAARTAAQPFTAELFEDTEDSTATLADALADMSRSAVAALLMELEAEG